MSKRMLLAFVAIPVILVGGGKLSAQEPGEVPLVEAVTHFAASPAMDEGKGMVLVTWATPAGGVEAAIFDPSGSLTRQVRVSNDQVLVLPWPLEDRALSCVTTTAHHFVAWSIYNNDAGKCVLKVAVLSLKHEVLRIVELDTGKSPQLHFRSLSLTSVVGGNVLVAYFAEGQQSEGQVVVRHLTPEGLVGGPGVIASNRDAHTRITSGQNGGAIVTWWSREGSFHSNEVAFLNAEGHVTSGPFEVESHANGPASIVNANGDALVVFMQVFFAARLRVARVHPDGTGVSEVQELVNDDQLASTERPLAVTDGRNGAVIIVFRNKYREDTATYTGEVLGGFYTEAGSFSGLDQVADFPVNPYNVELVPDGGGGAYVYLRDEVNARGIPTNSLPARVYVRHFNSHGSSCVVSPQPFRRGNANGDRMVDVSDAITILLYLFRNQGELQCLDAADVNDDGRLNITDAVVLLNFLFLGGPPPRPPHGAEGLDETRGDPLGCSAFTPQVCRSPRPPDTQPPTSPTNLTATAVAPTQVNVRWSPSTDNVGVAGYHVLRSLTAGGPYTMIASVTTTSYQNTVLASDTAYYYVVRAYDAANNVSGNSNEANARTQQAPDTSPPSNPAGLTATTVSQSQINLSWSPSNDNRGVTGYQVLRGTASGSYTLVTTVTTTSYQNSRLQPGTAYYYVVRAYDAAGNVSGNSNEAMVRTQLAPDTAPPSNPTNLTASAVSPTQINLTWSPSTDNVGVIGYHVLRSLIAGGPYTQIVSTVGTTYQNTGLAPQTTYYYVVRAYDAAGNTSANSRVAMASTPALPGAPR